MLQKFQNHIQTKFPFLQEKRLLLAVSGGVDSMVLLYLCHQLDLNFAVAHCNFQLRGDESDGDEIFVKVICEALKRPVFTQKFVTAAFAKEQKQSIQVVARNLRYEWFNTLLQKYDYDYVLTAHQLDDSIETFLINFTRGTGLQGLTGIPEQNGKIIRPMLIFSRNEIATFAKNNKVLWREDSSNASDRYVRNKLRHQVLPVLKELNPNLLVSFQDTMDNLQQAQNLVEDVSNIMYQKVVAEVGFQKKINLDTLLQHSNYKAYLFQWLQSYGFKDWRAIYDLVTAQSGKQIFSETHTILKDRNQLLVYPTLEESKAVYFVERLQEEVKIPLKISFCNVDDISDVTTSAIFVDEEKLRFPLEIRKWQEGDYFYPIGMTGKKKLSKYFKDEKLSLLDKSNTWLLCSDNQIVWVVGKRQDHRFKTEINTTRILKIQYQE
jgi:tRNA(Ile)-lysidine synthase